MNNNPSFPTKLLRSLYDIGYYVEVLKHKTSKTVKFAIAVGLFFGSLSMIGHLVELNRTIDSIVRDMELHLPPFTVVNGILSNEGNTPYALNMEGLAIVVDPGSEQTGLQSGADYGFYFTKDRMFIKNGISSGQSMAYKDLLKEDFGKEELIGLISTMRLGGWLLIPLGALYGVLMIFISSMVAMFFGRVVFAFSRKPLGYRDSFVIAVHAQVITAILYLMTTIFSVQLPLFYPLCLMVMGFYYLKLARWDETEHPK